MRLYLVDSDCSVVRALKSILIHVPGDSVSNMGSWRTESGSEGNTHLKDRMWAQICATITHCGGNTGVWGCEGSRVSYLYIYMAMVLQEEVRIVRHHPAVSYDAAGPVGHRVQSPPTVFGEPVPDDDCSELHVLRKMAPAVTRLAGFVGSARMLLLPQYNVAPDWTGTMRKNGAIERKKKK